MTDRVRREIVFDGALIHFAAFNFILRFIPRARLGAR